MLDLSVEEISLKLRRIREVVRMLGCKLKYSLTTMSFLTLPVTSKLKITDKGLVDKFEIPLSGC
jgi:adenine deaminase